MDLIYIIVGAMIVLFIAVIIIGRSFRKRRYIGPTETPVPEGDYDELAEERRAIKAKEEELLVEHPYFKVKKLRLQKEKAEAAGDQVKVAELDDRIDEIREKWDGATEEQLERAYHQQLAVMRKRLSQIEIQMREILRRNE